MRNSANGNILNYYNIMKKLFYIFCSCALIATSCSQHEISETPLTPHGSEWDFHASFDDKSSRTLLNEQMKNVWSFDDRISIFMGNSYNHHYKFNGATGDTSGTFSKVDDPFITGEVLNANYAIYPYSAENSIDENGVIHTSLPAVQTYNSNSFGLNANTMVAVTESLENRFLSFQNVCGYVRVKLYGDNVTIKSVTLTGNNEEILGGTAQIAAAYNQIPQLSMAGASAKTLTVDCGNGVKIGTTEYDATSFVFVVPPTAMEKGFTIVATDVDGNTFTKVTNNSQEVKRNTILTMPELKWTDDGKPKFEIPEGVLTIHNEEKGMLLIALMDYAYDEIVSMKITGTMNDEDFLWIYYEMPALRYLDISEVNITTLPNKCFYQSSNVETLIMPNSLQTISDSAFYQSVVKEIYLNDGLLTIGTGAFKNCKGLTSIHIPHSVTTIGDNAFYDCTNLASVTFADGCNLSALAKNVFYGTAIESIQIPANVNSIATSSDSPFYSCNNLKTVTFEANSQLKTLGKSFEKTSLETIEIPNSVETISAFYKIATLKDVYFEANSQLKTIAAQAFYGCGISTITIPASTEILGDESFYTCPNLSSIQFENNSQLTYIGECAFYETPIESIIIPASVQTIGIKAFWYCESLAQLTFEENSNLSLISDSAFYHCISLESVTIPKSVVTIDKSAFYYSGLTSVTFEEGSKLERIEGAKGSNGDYDYRFGAFGSTNIKTIEFPSSLTMIGGSAFADCSNLQKITFPDDSKLDGIYLGAFARCALTSITLPASLRIIGIGAFESNSKLRIINFKENTQLENIKDSAFRNCGTINYVYAQNVTNLKLIENNVFYGCNEMRLFKLGTVAVPTASSSSFGDIGTYSVLKVPTESVAAYKQATGWKGFSSITGLDE